MINDLKADDIDQAVAISDMSVGENYLSYDSFKHCIDDVRKTVKVFRINNEIAGFIKGQLIEKNILRNILLKTDHIINNELTGNEMTGIIETICVKAEYRGSSIAGELTDEMIAQFNKTADISAIYTTIWKTDEKINAKKLFEKKGFKCISEIQDYWYADSIEKQYNCPKCGKPPCKCSMLFYKLSNF